MTRKKISVTSLIDSVIGYKMFSPTMPQIGQPKDIVGDPFTGSAHL